MREKEFLGKEKIGTLLRKFAIPSIVAMLVSALYNIVDQFFIGQKVGTLGIAATNVAFPLNTMCTSMGLLVGIGCSSIFNITMGKGDRKKATFYYGNGAVLLLLEGSLLMIVTQFFLSPMLMFFGATDNVIDYAKQYTSITSFGFPFLVYSLGGGHLVRADGSPTYAMLCNLSGAIVNTILDALLINVFDMGMRGAAIATIIGQMVSATMVFCYMRRCKSIELKSEHLILKFKYVADIVKLGIGPFTNQLAMLVVQIVLNKSLNRYDTISGPNEAIPLTVAGIITKVNMLYLSVVIGLSQGMQPIASFNFGAHKYDRVKEVYKLVLKCGLTASVIAFAAFQVFTMPIIRFFGEGSQAYYDFAAKYFHIYLFFTFLNCIQPASSTFFTSIGDSVKGAFLSLTRQTLFLLPLIAVLPIFFGIDGIMYAGPIADFMAAVVAIIMIRSTLKKLDAK
ncbi:MAG: MATE family efflux transporter [Lachnospiraceae bacterium]|nr:MATE family efflux transporter [Lachnospiraceae bacterium]